MDVQISFSIHKHESPLPLTDPRDAEAQRMLNSVTRHIVIKPLLLLGLAAECRSLVQIPGLALASVNLRSKFEVFNCTRCEYMKDDTKGR